MDQYRNASTQSYIEHKMSNQEIEDLGPRTSDLGQKAESNPAKWVSREGNETEPKKNSDQLQMILNKIITACYH